PLFQNHSWNADITVPHGKVRYGSGCRYQEDIAAFLNSLGAVTENLNDSNASILIVDQNVDVHLIERENRGIRLLGAGRDQNTGLRSRSGWSAHREDERNCDHQGRARPNLTAKKGRMVVNNS